MIKARGRKLCPCNILKLRYNIEHFKKEQSFELNSSKLFLMSF